MKTITLTLTDLEDGTVRLSSDAANYGPDEAVTPAVVILMGIYTLFQCQDFLTNVGVGTFEMLEDGKVPHEELVPAIFLRNNGHLVEDEEGNDSDT